MKIELSRFHEGVSFHCHIAHFAWTKGFNRSAGRQCTGPGRVINHMKVRRTLNEDNHSITVR